MKKLEGANVSEEAMSCTSPWSRSQEMSPWPGDGAAAEASAQSPYVSCVAISELLAGNLKMRADGIEETVRAVGA